MKTYYLSGKSTSIAHTTRTECFGDLFDYGGNSSHTYVISPGTSYVGHKTYRPELCYWDKNLGPAEKLERRGYFSDQISIRGFKNAVINSRAYGVVINNRGDTVCETTRALDFQKPQWRQLNIEKISYFKSDSTEGSFLYTLHGNYGVYAHYIFETVGTIHALKDLIEKNDIRIIMPPGRMNFPSHILEMIGISHDKQFFRQHPSSTFQNLLVSSTCSGSATFYPNEMVRDFSNYCVERWGSKEKNRVRLYITRNGSKTTSTRVYLDDLELSEKLKNYGFLTIDPASLTFSQQIEIFSKAEIIVGAHGSHFANLIFAPKDCMVFDLVPYHWANIGGNFTLNLTNFMEQGYAYLLCKSHKRSNDIYSSLNPDIVIDRIRKYLIA